MKNNTVGVAFLMAAAAVLFALPARAESVTFQYCNGGFNAQPTTAADCTYSDGDRFPSINGSSGSPQKVSWATFSLPMDPVAAGDSIVVVMSQPDCDNSGNNTIGVYAMKHRPTASSQSTWNTYNGSNGWVTPGGLSSSDRVFLGNVECPDLDFAQTFVLDTDGAQSIADYNTIGFYPADTGMNTYWYGAVHMNGTMSIEHAVTPSHWECANCASQPLLQMQLTVGNQTFASSSIFVPYIDSAFPNSTNTIPMCFVRHAFGALDSFIGLITNDYASTTPLTFQNGSSTPLVFTLQFLSPEEMPSWVQDLIAFSHAVFAFVGWSMLGWKALSEWIGSDDD